MKKLFNVLFAIFILSLSIIPVFIPDRVEATVSTLAIDSEGTCPTGTYGTYIGGAENYTNLNSDDGATSRIQFLESHNHSYNYVDFSTGYASIDSVTLYLKGIRSSTEVAIYPLCRIAGTNYLGTPIVFSTVSYTLGSYTWNTNPATGSAWTATTLNAAEFGWKSYTIGGSYWQCITYSYLSIDYVSNALPTVTTSAADNITYSGGISYADLHGNITGLGEFDNCTDRGFVWDTISRSLVSENVTPAASGYTNTYTESAAYTTGTFAHTAGSLTAGTTYYFRAFAKNTLGYDYGSELYFSTIGTPSIIISPATSISINTATINSSVSSDGSQPCDVRFGYGITTQATVAAYDNQTAWVIDTYDTGETPFASLVALNGATTYYFRAEIRNDIGSSESAEATFSTVNAVNEPSSITVIPTATSLSINWIKGSGAPYTLVRYQAGSYPITTASGILAYLGTGESVIVSGLAPGTTYFISAWGKSGATYSTLYKTTLTTMLAYDPGISTINNLEEQPTNSTFLQIPSETKVDNIPLISGLIEANSTSYGTPKNMIWYLFWIGMAVLIFVVIYNRLHFNFEMSAVATLIWMGTGVTLGLVMLLIPVLLIIIGFGFKAFADRR